MDEGYTRVMVEENAALIGTILRRLAEPTSYPAIIHCSAGKDRTAVIIALLLHILGVPWQTILADYALSNLHYDKFRAGIQADIESLHRLGITVDHMQAVMLVKAERLQKMRQHIEHNYGSITQYLQTKAGINEKIMAQLRCHLLA
jgi:protein-tyrosine phosphatase